ncbi:hypothetical protein [Vitiosangium sp. GDMCC 1.1324]|uniref:hypothetical protein n=1 Tax=Vitiosangium sp. (strain GDMCC 1.1324) TaxID=2138576 RepID=UPI000D384C81|nr:hypothetical protein [Vitiosangium sp. GDMCC 1.1324]PTL83447.1 hypothetical protein DAT35_15865 [Vitiosangium sp. GDMCC 1.1324]
MSNPYTELTISISYIPTNPPGDRIQIAYDHAPYVKPGGTVTFQLLTSGVSVSVDFGTNSCLSAPSFTLPPSPHTEPVETSASGWYNFTVNAPDISLAEKERKLGGNYEAKVGKLDVTTDPPPPKEDKKDKKDKKSK